MTRPALWYVAVVRFGAQTARTSALGHLTADGRRTLCGVELAEAVPAPLSFIRCDRCIDARAKL